MSRPSPDSEANYPEYAVRRETISSYFHPPLAASTFHDLVNKGKILPVKGLRGFYRLNESLKRLGLREVPHPPSEHASRSTVDIVGLALTLVDPDTFPAPSWALCEAELDPRDLDHARVVADLHRESILALPTFQERAGYAAGVLDAQTMMDEEVGKGAE